MGLNLSDFFVENTILSASEQGLVYDLPRDSIQEAWNKLALHYDEKIKEEAKSEILVDEFYRLLACSRVENETAMETFGLVKRGILECYESMETTELRVNIKRVILDGVMVIVRHRLAELRENIQNEADIYGKIRHLAADIKITDRSLRIYPTPLSFITFDCNLLEKKYTGLTCIVRCRDCEYEGHHVENIEEFAGIDVSTLEGTFQKNGIKIIISNEFSSMTHPVCTAVIKEFLKGKRAESILAEVPVLLSRFQLNELIKSSNQRRLIQSGSKKLIDGLTPTFYIITDMGVVKVMRSKDSFELLLNGARIPTDRSIF